jgi:hypothetical protein
MSVIAVDWSGDLVNSRRHIWLAEAASPARLAQLVCGRDREELADYLALRNDVVAIGLDFAFSFPAWFIPDVLGVSTAPDLWACATLRGESWLSECEPPFWGRPGHRRPRSSGPAFRRTELAVPRTSGIAPKSIFQIGGAGAVGTGSIRGMPLLYRLHAAGVTIWPFTCGRSPVVVEIYPRLLTGPVHKSDSAARERFVKERYPHLDSDHVVATTRSEDAFDATVSALVMFEHLSDLLSLAPEDDPVLRVEGRIWHPNWRDDRP